MNPATWAMKATPPEQYEAELEKLLIEIAKVGAQIRAKS